MPSVSTHQQAGQRVDRDDERGAEGDRHEGEEEEVDRRQDLRRDPRPEERVQDVERMRAAQHVLLEGQQVHVEVLARDERQEALEVPVGEVRHVEGDDPEQDDRQPPPRPALADELGHPGPQLRPAPAAAPDRARDDVDRHEEPDRPEQEHDAPAEDPVGVPEGQVVRPRDDVRDHEHDHAEHERGDQREEACAGERLAAGGCLDAVFPDAGICRIEACGDGWEG